MPKHTRSLIPILAFLLALAAGPGAVAEEPVYPKLTPKLQDLLQREMLSVQKASQEILAALIAGEDAEVAALAQQIRDSFILKQEMTEEDKTDLMAAVPKEFVAMDRRFHELAAGLATAAESGDRQAQHERFSEMLDACSACHSTYATDRFPGFAD